MALVSMSLLVQPSHSEAGFEMRGRRHKDRGTNRKREDEDGEILRSEMIKDKETSKNFER